jgi:aminomethyltransferase
MNRTVLYETHRALGAKMVPFSGWEMPLSYAGGVPEEHRVVRTTVGLFDITHMGRFELSGPGAEAYLDQITPGPVCRLPKGGAQYTLLLNEAGGILDDIYIYKRGSDRYFIIVNAANRKKDFAWMTRHLPATEVTLRDVSDTTALFALQGPKSWELLVQLLPFGKSEIPLRHFIETERVPAWGDIDIGIGIGLIGRTGYTGERGYEIVVPVEAAEAVWNALMTAGQPFGIQPIGLGARDTLRLEMGYPLYGHDMTEATLPSAADLIRFVDMGKAFIGKEALEKDLKPSQILIGFQLLAEGIPREGCLIALEQKTIGRVTSGNFSPTLRKGIGMGYIDARYAEEGTELFIDVRGRAIAAVIVKRPFYSKKRNPV